jgi:hypothetical protein
LRKSGACAFFLERGVDTVSFRAQGKTGKKLLEALALCAEEMLNTPFELKETEELVKITLVQIRYSKNDLIGIINWSYVKLTGKSLFNSPFF